MHDPVNRAQHRNAGWKHEWSPAAEEMNTDGTKSQKMLLQYFALLASGTDTVDTEKYKMGFHKIHLDMTQVTKTNN